MKDPVDWNIVGQPPKHSDTDTDQLIRQDMNSVSDFENLSMPRVVLSASFCESRACGSFVLIIKSVSTEMY